MISYRTKQCWTKSGVDTNHVKVDFTRLICLIYIKSENMVWKSGKNRGKIINKKSENRNFHSIETASAPENVRHT